MFARLALLASLLLVSCETERHIYDASGKEIDPNAKGPTTLEDRFKGDFGTKKNADGIPEATSGKVSSFQGELDKARRSGDESSDFASKQFGGSKSLDWRSKNFEEGSRQYMARDVYRGDDARSSITRDKRPDFLNKGRGIVHKDAAAESGHMLNDNERDRIALESGLSYHTNDSRYNRDQKDSYMEQRRNNTPPPTIYSKQQYSQKTVAETRAMLGRDN